MQIETANRFAVIGDLKKVRIFDVYIDGSFGPKHTVDDKGNSPYGSGWAMVNKYSNERELMGYGMTQFWDKHSPHSTVGELRSILQFFEGLAEYFPHMIKQKYKYYVTCDNANLVQLLSKSQINKDAARSAKEKYGEDYTNLINFMRRTNIAFNWVKGHADNKFNCFADAMANKAYRTGLLNQAFDRKARIEYISVLLNSYELTPPQKLQHNKPKKSKKLTVETIDGIKPFKKPEKWEEGNNIHIGTAFVKDEINTCHQGVVFSTDGGKTLTSGTYLIAEVTEEVSKISVQLDAFQRVLFAYRTAAGVDTSTPLNIFTNNNSVCHVINSLSNNVIPDVDCPKLASEIDNLRILMTGMNIRGVYDKHLLGASLKNYALRLARQSAGKSSQHKASHEVLIENKELVNQ